MRSGPAAYALLWTAVLAWLLVAVPAQSQDFDQGPDAETSGAADPSAAAEGAEAEAEEEEDELDIRADSVEFDAAQRVYVARGNVRISKGETVISADWVAFSNTTQQGVATGNVLISEAGDTLVADALHFELDDLLGVIYGGELSGDDTDFQMQGDRIKRLDKQRYLFHDAAFTTCKCPDGERDPWRIRAETADLNLDGYATTKNTKVDILGVPLLWTPWMQYPLKTDRKTGLLFPTFATSERTGFDVSVPFFWAVHDQVNVILEPRYLTNRGFKPEAEIEYVFGAYSLGELYGSFIDDDDIDPTNPSTPFDSQRWGVEWLHIQELPWDWWWKVDARFASDNSYAFDFRDFSRFRSDRFMEAVSFLEKRFGLMGRFGFTAAAYYADDVSAPDDLDRDAFLLQRLPDLWLSGRPMAPTPLPWLQTSFDLRYTHFWAKETVEEAMPEVRETIQGVPGNTTTLDLGVGDDVFFDTGIDALPNGRERDANGNIVRLDGTVELRDGTIVTIEEFLAQAPPPEEGEDPEIPILELDGSQDDFPGPEGDGIFSEGEPLGDRGHRVVVNPRIQTPFRLFDAVEVLPELGWHGTFYNTDNQGSTTRNLVTANVDMRSRFRGRVNLPVQGPVNHVLEPRFSWTFVSDVGQTGNPLFIPRPQVMQKRLRQYDVMNIVRDPSDRIEGANAITVGLGNRFYLPGSLDEEGLLGPAELVADVAFSFQHDFEDDQFTAFYADGTLFPFYNVRARFNFGWDFNEGEIAESNLEVGWYHPAGHDLRVLYRFVQDVPRFFENFRFDTERFEDFEEGFLRINQIDVLTRIALTQHIGLTYRIAYSFEDALVLANQVGVEYLSRCYCWALRVQASQRRTEGFTFNFQYRIIGLGEDTVRPFSGVRTRTRRTDSLVGDY